MFTPIYTDHVQFTKYMWWSGFLKMTCQAMKLWLLLPSTNALKTGEEQLNIYYKFDEI